jgi:hypothetical protein
VKTNPDSYATPRPGSGGLAKDPGDKAEVHTSEEELGVTMPRLSTSAQSTKTKGGAQ